MNENEIMVINPDGVTVPVAPDSEAVRWALEDEARRIAVTAIRSATTGAEPFAAYTDAIVSRIERGMHGGWKVVA